MKNEEKRIWTNWSGDIRFSPTEVRKPTNEEELQLLLQNNNQRSVRTIGATHSCSPIFATDQTLIDMGAFKGLHAYNLAERTATIGAATTVEEAGEELFKIGLGMENTGHINKQCFAGAIATGTHGAGKRLTNLSGQVIGIKLVTGIGEIKTFTKEKDPAIMQALRVSLGSMGVFTELTLKLLPLFTLHRRQYCALTEDCMNHLDILMNENRNFCFYWYPRRDDVSIKLWNFPGEGTAELPYATLYKQYTGWGKDVLPTPHQLKYNELEYSLDLQAAPACFEEIRKRILKRHTKEVAWRVLYRPIAADNAYLSNAYGRDTVAITIHQNAVFPYQAYFDDIEKIFQEHGGRPHWGKKHTMKAVELKQLYPMWDEFQRFRKEFDPNGIFLNDYLKSIFLQE
jgi:FAD/FMN-containing dehydrogenase